jgi:hypothetical protein
VSLDVISLRPPCCFLKTSGYVLVELEFAGEPLAA